MCVCACVTCDVLQKAAQLETSLREAHDLLYSVSVLPWTFSTHCSAQTFRPSVPASCTGLCGVRMSVLCGVVTGSTLQKQATIEQLNADRSTLQLRLERETAARNRAQTDHAINVDTHSKYVLIATLGQSNAHAPLT